MSIDTSILLVSSCLCFFIGPSFPALDPITSPARHDRNDTPFLRRSKWGGSRCLTPPPQCVFDPASEVNITDSYSDYDFAPNIKFNIWAFIWSSCAFRVWPQRLVFCKTAQSPNMSRPRTRRCRLKKPADKTCASEMLRLREGLEECQRPAFLSIWACFPQSCPCLPVSCLPRTSI